MKRKDDYMIGSGCGGAKLGKARSHYVVTIPR
jgi:hypothetical protein